MADTAYEPRAVWKFHLPQSLKDSLDTYASKNNLSSSHCLREAISLYLGIKNPTVHGNAKYATDAERLAAKRRNSRKRSKAYRERKVS